MSCNVKSASICRPLLTAALTAGILAGFPGYSRAAADVPAKTVEVRTLDLRSWKPDPSTGWSVKKLIGKKVRGPTGKNVGEVDNIVFSPEGNVRELIVSTGGFLGVGDKNLAVKWSDVTVGPGYEYVTTPITAESVKKYGLFDGFPKTSGPLAPRDWRASELIGDYVNLKGNVPYAFIRDLIVSEGGELKAVIVTPDVGFDHGQGGYYAYPFYGYQHGWHPGNAHYNLPYGKADIMELLPYAYRK
ncbi:PRC-barrel domain-containing protein [Thermomonas sp.]|uniref:PRC-barrel domain-containing protein n=1 Tax=Thermomonas sp. TaxID=1971895 RepID=UPI0024873B97|nr:PRC-barrel domain-containing protein [Thermomonas sp.]MDI1252493.1 PRC-barrel domain-containing protein [Thermomonas sp.]